MCIDSGSRLNIRERGASAHLSMATKQLFDQSFTDRQDSSSLWIGINEEDMDGPADTCAAPSLPPACVCAFYLKQVWPYYLEHGSRQLQLELCVRSDTSNRIIEEATHHFFDLMFDTNGMWVIRACFKLLLSKHIGVTEEIDGAQKYLAASCAAVLQYWDLVVDSPSFVVVMWTIESLYMMHADAKLQVLCQKALHGLPSLTKAPYGHNVLQHAVLFTHKALLRNSGPENRADFSKIRNGFFDAAVEILPDRSVWSSDGSFAGLFISLCIDLLLANCSHANDDLIAHWARFMRVVTDDHDILRIIASHSDGKFCARRIFQMGSSQERLVMEQQVPVLRHRQNVPMVKAFRHSLVSHTELLFFRPHRRG